VMRATLEWASIAVGDRPEPKTVGPVGLTDFVRYQGASGDMNPLHHDVSFARNAGFSTVISPGMFQAGLLGSFATAWLGADTIRVFKVRFKEPVFPGDTLTMTAAVVDKRHVDDAHLVDVVLECMRQTGGVAVEGRATFDLTEPQAH
jgi:acyl dehydratase